ncbi:hypothetical protein GCM10026983_41530 [Gracilibacillus alcaliphilus]
MRCQVYDQLDTDLLCHCSICCTILGRKLIWKFDGYCESTINTFEQAYDIMDAVNRKSEGLVFACFLLPIDF